MSRADVVLKRVFDVVVASLLVVVTLPVLIIALVGSAISLRAWPLFTQDRVGRGGEVFRFPKVRTLPITTNAYADKYALVDVRIPRFTALLRALHLDELPQLLLVVRGRMSLVGPRPELPNLHETLEPSFAALRTSLRPGCTGPWQVSDRCDGLIGEAPEFDTYYVERRTLSLDLGILLRTATKMIGISGRLTYRDLVGSEAEVVGTEAQAAPSTRLSAQVS